MEYRLRKFSREQKLGLSFWLNGYQRRSHRQKIEDLMLGLCSSEVISHMENVGLLQRIKSFVDQDAPCREAFETNVEPEEYWQEYSVSPDENLRLNRRYVRALFGREKPKKSGKSSFYKLRQIIKYKGERGGNLYAWNYMYEHSLYIQSKYGYHPDLQLSHQLYPEEGQEKLTLGVGVYLLKRYSTLKKGRISLSSFEIAEVGNYKIKDEGDPVGEDSKKKVAWTYLEKRYGLSDEGAHYTLIKGRIMRCSMQYKDQYHLVGTGNEYLNKKKDFENIESPDHLIDEKIYESMTLRRRQGSSDTLEGLLLSSIRSTGEPYCTKVILNSYKDNLATDSEITLLIEKISSEIIADKGDLAEIQNTTSLESGLLTLG